MQFQFSSPTSRTWTMDDSSTVIMTIGYRTLVRCVTCTAAFLSIILLYFPNMWSNWRSTLSKSHEVWRWTPGHASSRVHLLHLWRAAPARSVVKLGNPAGPKNGWPMCRLVAGWVKLGLTWPNTPNTPSTTGGTTTAPKH